MAKFEFRAWDKDELPKQGDRVYLYHDDGSVKSVYYLGDQRVRWSACPYQIKLPEGHLIGRGAGKHATERWSLDKNIVELLKKTPKKDWR